ncbi:hypothetical protein EJB05_29391, partial [Eragrostis curvula]
MPPLSVKSNLVQCATSYRFRFRCCLVEFLSRSTSQGFDCCVCSSALYRLDPVKSGDASAGIRAVLGQYII